VNTKRFHAEESPPQPAGCVTATMLLLLLSKKYAAHFFEFRQAGTEPKEASFAVTVFNSKNDLKSILLMPGFTMNCNNNAYSSNGLE
jgi:hypothetical protein